SSRRRHTRFSRDWSSDVCSSDLEGLWLSKIVGIGETLGSQGAIAVGGLLLGSVLTAADTTALKARTGFTCWFAAGCAAVALLLKIGRASCRERVVVAVVEGGGEV